MVVGWRSGEGNILCNYPSVALLQLFDIFAHFGNEVVSLLNAHYFMQPRSVWVVRHRRFHCIRVITQFIRTNILV